MSYLYFYKIFLSCMQFSRYIRCFCILSPVLFEPSGDNEIRTRDLLLARQALSQLSYTPIILDYVKLYLFYNYGLKWTLPPQP